MTAERDEAVTSREGAHHQSSIETILDGCSWQYYLNNIKKIPTPPKPHSLMGTAYHSAIEAHELSRMYGNPTLSLSDMISIADQEILKQSEALTDEMMVDKDGNILTVDNLLDMCRFALNNWYNEKTKDGISHRDWLLRLTPVAIEPYFKLQLVDDALPIGGWIDGVYKDEEGNYLLVDQKTAGDFTRWSYDGNGHRYQATMYGVALVLSEDFPEITELDKINMHYLVSRTRTGNKNLEKARHVIVKPELDDVALLGERIRQVEFIIKNNLYAPNPSWFLCKPRFCSFYNECQVTGNLRKAPIDIIRRYKDE
jgi:hypothetical protein